MTGAPPFRLPGIHFGGAIAWLLLGGTGLCIVAPDLAAARFLTPRVAAVTHLYTLGVIVASVFGAQVSVHAGTPCKAGSGYPDPVNGDRAKAARQALRLEHKLPHRHHV